MDLDMLNRAYDSYFKSTKTSAAEEAFFKSNFNTLDAFIQSHDVDYSKTPANDSIVKNAESKLGVKFGPQLYKYLTQYGYLGYEFVEFHGITKQQGLNSDMVKDTLKVHKMSQDTRNMIVIENQGEGDYFLVDSNDKVYEFDINMGKVVPTKYSLFRYIEYRFNLTASSKKEPATEGLFKGKSSPLTRVVNLYNQANQKYDDAEDAKNDTMFLQARDIYNKADAAMKKVLSQIKGMSQDQFYKTMIDPFGESEFRKNFPWAVRNSSGKPVVCMSDKFITVYNGDESISYAMDIARINNMAYKIHYYALELKYVYDPWLTPDQKEEAISKLDIMVTGDLKFRMKDADDFK